MKRILAAGFIALSLWCGDLDAAEGKFTSGLSPAELTAAGLASLTPEQLARLNALVEDYKNGAGAGPVRTSETVPAVSQPATVRSSRAPAATRSTQASSSKPAATGGVITQAKDWLKQSAAGPAPVSESTIVGKFRGWEAKQVFALANGEHWRVANADSYYTPVVESPRVVVVPTSLGGYWMEFPDLKVRVRVNPLGER